MTSDAIFRLAELIGWKYHDPSTDRDPGPIRGRCHFTRPYQPPIIAAEWQPFTDANDSNTLRMFLIKKGWHIEERWEPVSEISSDGYWLEIWHPCTEIHEQLHGDHDIWMALFAMTVLNVLERSNEPT